MTTSKSKMSASVSKLLNDIHEDMESFPLLPEDEGWVSITWLMKEREVSRGGANQYIDKMVRKGIWEARKFRVPGHSGAAAKYFRHKE